MNFDAMEARLAELGVPEPQIIMLAGGIMGVSGAWPWENGQCIRHGVRVPVGAVDEAAQKLKEWWDARNARRQGQAETEATA